MSKECFDIKTWQTKIHWNRNRDPKFAKKGLSNKSKRLKFFYNVYCNLQQTGGKSILIINIKISNILQKKCDLKSKHFTVLSLNSINRLKILKIQQQTYQIKIYKTLPFFKKAVGRMEGVLPKCVWFQNDCDDFASHFKYSIPTIIN